MLLVAAYGWVFGWANSSDVLELVQRSVRHWHGSPSFTTDAAALQNGDRVRRRVSHRRLFVGRHARQLAARSAAISHDTDVAGVHGASLRLAGVRDDWPAVCWIGQQHRVGRLVSAAESTVSGLKSNWPTMDGELPEVGPFLAYPSSAPTALLPLSEAAFPNTRVPFSAVERTGDEAMRFELAGSEVGAWLEWRADASEPQSFVGGLETHYDVERFAGIAPHWFLVRYRANLAASG